ncbi:MAG TPA: hypothetical protein VIK65_03850 [Candidatus Limnocylindrales bacterium]|jgi:hypothetical protein
MPVAIWQQFNPRERLMAIGAGLVVLAFLVSIVTFGIGANTLAVILAIAALAVLYLKYAPNTKINWPASPSLILMALSAAVAIIVLLDLLRYLSLLGYASYFGGLIIALVLEVVGAGLMAWGAWQEYQIEKPAMPNFGSTAGTGASTTAPPPAAPTSAPPAAPMAPPPASDVDQPPPA